jgi:hypothetical protein
MSASAQSAFLVEAVNLDGIRVGREDGRLVARRDLADDEVSVEDVLELARTHGLQAADMVVDVPDGETRVHLEVAADE